MEALARVARDPALSQWFEEQRHFDSAIAAHVQSLPVPAELRSRILTGARVSRPQSWFFSPRRLWAIAAAILVFAALGAWYSMSRSAPDDSWEGGALGALTALTSGREQFDASSADAAELQRWLKANGSPSAALPARMQRLASLGCKRLLWKGHRVSIICFHGPGGELVHLAMVERSALPNPPPEGHPEYETRDGWRMACWSQGNMAMMLATRASESQLRELLSSSVSLIYHLASIAKT